MGETLRGGDPTSVGDPMGGDVFGGDPSGCDDLMGCGDAAGCDDPTSSTWAAAMI